MKPGSISLADILFILMIPLLRLGAANRCAIRQGCFPVLLTGIMIRTFSHDSVIELAKYATVPVINGLTDLLHPCQALTDMFTIMEHKEILKGRKLVYVGDGNNMAHSLMYACAKVGMNMVCASPKGYQPDPEIVRTAQEDAALTGCTIEVDEDLFRAAKGADVLYTDVWASMGQEAEQSIRQEALGDYQINKELLSVARPDAMVLHCLPAHRGEEITEEVLEGPQSKVFDQAEKPPACAESHYGTFDD